MINTPFVFSTRSLYRNEATFIDFSLLRSGYIGVCIIDSIPHCPTENALKSGKSQEMWLRCYIEDGFVTISKTKLEYVSSIVFHTVLLI